jgi:hypothetical protein
MAGNNFTNLSIVTDATVVAAGGSSSNVLQILFPAGMQSGVAPGSLFYKGGTFFPARQNQMYVSFLVKGSVGYVGDAAGRNKLVYWNFTPANSGYASGIGSIQFLGTPDGSNPFQPGLVTSASAFIQGPDDPDGAPPTVRMFGNKVSFPSNAATLGVWHRYEVLVINNTPGNTDGTLRWWLDGVLVGDYTNRIAFTATGAPISDMSLSPTYGGGPLPVPHDQYLWFKDLYVSGKQ